ncbi:hypothetical protein Aduo_011914 [Ancylostoma duodenale]
MIKASSSENSARTSKSWTYRETTQYGCIVDSELENSDEFNEDDGSTLELGEEGDSEPDLDPILDDYSNFD